MIKLSVALATYNEERNIGPCLKLVKDWVDEIIVVDGSSQDKTAAIARKHGARVIITDNPPIFHINKQKALDACRGKWILQLDADERVTQGLKKEIEMVVSLSDQEIEEYQEKIPAKKKRLFLKHQRLLEKRDGEIGLKKGPYAGFFFPRLNYFLGKPLRYGGVYPDGVIRLIRNGKARFPCQSVHEQIVIKGRVGWLQNNLIDCGDINLKKYLQKNSQYIDLIAKKLREQKIGKNFLQAINHFLFKPVHWFLLTIIRHKGFLDGWRGFVFSFFSALRFPRAYWRCLIRNKRK